MDDIKSKLQALRQLRDEQQQIKKEFMVEYLRIRNTRRHKDMAVDDNMILQRLTDINNELKKVEQATIVWCLELTNRIKNYVKANSGLISSYSLTVEISCWGNQMAEGKHRFYVTYSPEIIAEIEPFDGFAVAKGESEMQQYKSSNLLDVKDECWLYYMFRSVIGLTPLALLSIKGMGTDVMIRYKNQLKYSNGNWIKI